MNYVSLLPVTSVAITGSPTDMALKCLLADLHIMRLKDTNPNHKDTLKYYFVYREKINFANGTFLFLI